MLKFTKKPTVQEYVIRASYRALVSDRCDDDHYWNKFTEAQQDDIIKKLEANGLLVQTAPRIIVVSMKGASD